MRTILGGKIKIPAGYTLHHLKPKRFGGETIEENVKVPLKIHHKAWTRLFDKSSIEPADIPRLLEGYWNLFKNEQKYVHEVRQIVFSVINNLDFPAGTFSQEEMERMKNILLSYKSIRKSQRDWNLLWLGKSLEEVVEDINDRWIDPDYKLVIKTIQNKRIVLVPRKELLIVLT